MKKLLPGAVNARWMMGSLSGLISISSDRSEILAGGISGGFGLLEGMT